MIQQRHTRVAVRPDHQTSMSVGREGGVLIINNSYSKLHYLPLHVCVSPAVEDSGGVEEGWSGHQDGDCPDEEQHGRGGLLGQVGAARSCDGHVSLHCHTDVAADRRHDRHVSHEVGNAAEIVSKDPVSKTRCG